MNKISRYKKIVSVFLLIFCFALAGLTTIGLILNLTPNNIAFLRTTAGVVKFELTDNITKEDDTIDKLSQKIKISGSGNKGEMGLIKVTANDIMFDYIINNQTHYFSAMDKTINKVSVATYAATNGTITISDKTGLVNFRNNVNNGNSYEGDTVKLSENIPNKKIDLLGDSWIPIGKDKDHPFKGVFHGNGNTILNFNITDQEYGGFFGYLIKSSIYDLQIANVTISGTQSCVGTLVCQGYGVTIWSCVVDSSVKIEGSYNYVGGLIGQLLEGRIGNCSVSTQIEVVGRSFPKYNGHYMYNLGYYNAIMVGGITALCGQNYQLGYVYSCLFSGKINVNDGYATAIVIAGIVAQTERADISGCAVLASMDASGSSIVDGYEADPPSAPSRKVTPLKDKVIDDIYGGFLYSYHTRHYGTNYIMHYEFKIQRSTGTYVTEEWEYGGFLGIGAESKKVTKSITIKCSNNQRVPT